ncbi:MAG: transporter substrate-binding domain-containing protein [Thalassobaculales bacterium]
MKKLFGLALAAMVSLAGVTAAHAGPTMDRIIKEKKLVVGVAPWNKFMLQNPKTGEFEGYIADDVKNLEAATGFKVEFVNTTWSGLIAGLQAGKWDIIMTGMGATPERAAAVAFSEPYGFISVTAMLKADNKAQSLADLDKPGNVIAVVAGTSQQKFSQKKFKQAKVTAFTDTGAAVLEVMQGRAAAYMGDSVSNALRAAERPNEVRNLTFPKETEWNSLNHAVRYDDLDLLAFVDAYVRTMRLRGWYKELAEKWGLPPELATGPQ